MGGCAGKSAVSNHKINPETVFIAAPVIHSESKSRLREQFESGIYSKFWFVYFAKVSERNSDGEVLPGVSGYVYN